jgi:DNA topoisomerase-1
MENNLDSIESSEVDSESILRRFYSPFKKELEAADDSMLNMRGVGFPTDFACPECGKEKLHVKIGKNGHYLACNGYPDCKFTINYTRSEKGKIEFVEVPKDEVSDKVCEKCGRPMVVKQGKFGPFLACSGYPECKATASLNSNGPGEDTGVKCPEKECDGHIVEKKSRRGKIFFSCNRYPNCKFATWDKPVAKECPDCGSKFLVEKSTKKAGKFLACNTKGCGYRETL